MTDRDLRDELERLCRELDSAADADGLPALAPSGHRRLLLGVGLALSLAACGETPTNPPYMCPNCRRDARAEDSRQRDAGLETAKPADARRELAREGGPDK